MFSIKIGHNICSTIAALLVVYCGASMAADKKPQSEAVFLSMAEAVTLSLSKNITIQFAGMDRVLEKFAIKKAENKFDLQYTLSASSTLMSKNGLTEDGDAIKPNVNINPGVSLKTSLGTGINFKIPQKISNKGKHTSNTTFKISQPLLQGFGRDINLVGLRNTYDAEVINKLKFRNSISKTIVEIAKKYRSLISDNYQIDASRKSLEDAARDITNTKAKIKAGRVASTEIVQSQAQYESLQLQYFKQKNSANISKQDLLTKIGLNPEMQIVVPKDLEVSTDDIPELNAAIQDALKNNFEYRSKVNSLKASRRRLTVAKNNMLWDLSLDYSGGFGGGTFKDTIKARNMHQSLSATLNIPINSYSNKEGLISANISVKKEELSFAQAKRTLIASVKKQLFDLDNLRTQIGFAKRSFELAGKSYSIEKKKLQIGKSSSLNVSTAQDKVLKTQESLIKSKISFENSLDDLHILLGTALDKWGIELEY